MPSWPRTEEKCSTRPPRPPAIIARAAACVGQQRRAQVEVHDPVPRLVGVVLRRIQRAARAAADRGDDHVEAPETPRAPRRPRRRHRRGGSCRRERRSTAGVASRPATASARARRDRGRPRARRRRRAPRTAACRCRPCRRSRARHARPAGSGRAPNHRSSMTDRSLTAAPEQGPPMPRVREAATRRRTLVAVLHTGGARALPVRRRVLPLYVALRVNTVRPPEPQVAGSDPAARAGRLAG